MNRKLMTLAVLLLALALSCTHEPLLGPGDPPVDPPVDPPPTVPAVVCFESEVLPIYQSYCAKAGCHDAITHEEGYTLNSYANITRKGIVAGKPNSSKLYTILYATGGDMMPPKNHAQLTAAQKDVIGKWISEGAKNTTGCNTSCDSTAFAFAANVKPIMNTYCVGCHSTSNPLGGIDLSTHAGVKASASTGKLLGSITWAAGFSKMPQGGNKLSDCQIAVVRKWINAGTPNN